MDIITSLEPLHPQINNEALASHPNRRVAVYYRVSTSRQEENQTIEAQVGAVKEHADQNGCEIIQEYRDDGWSGDSLIRPALDQLRVDAKNKARGWDALLVYDPDRIARRYSYQELVTDELREAGVAILFVTTPSPKTMEDKILHGVKGLFAEYERAKITERFRLGKVRKLKEGHILTSEAKYGYTYIPKKDRVHGYYVINEEEASVVRMIFHWVADEGLAMRAVTRRLKELKIPPRKSARGVWATSTLSTLLRHKAYIGQAHWGSSYAVIPDKPLKTDKYRRIKKSSRRDKPESEWYVVPVPPIIEKKVYERARERLKLNSLLAPRNRQSEYLLAGIIWCTCGRRCSGNASSQGKHLYYRCNDRIHTFPIASTCQEKGINARIADNLVWERLSGLMNSPGLMEEQIAIWLKNREHSTLPASLQLKELEVKKDKLKDQEDRYNKAFGAGLISLEQLREYTSPLRETASAIAAQSVKISNEANQAPEWSMPDHNAVKEFAFETAQTLGDLSFLQKRDIVIAATDKIIATQGRLVVSGYIPINHVTLRPEDRHTRNTTHHCQSGKFACPHAPLEPHGLQSIETSKIPRIPFYFEIPLPPPLKSGVDYGFRKGRRNP